MKKGDAIWVALLGCVVTVLLHPSTHGAVLGATKAHPFLMGFVKFAILASMGELLAMRILSRRWSIPRGVICRAAVWGLLGFCLVEMFAVFAAGVSVTIRDGLLPIGQNGLSRLMTAIWTSVIINLAIGPVLMVGHRIADTCIDLAEGKLSNFGRVRLHQVIEKTDWQGAIGFVCLKTLPLFWIPAHIVTFLLPSEYRLVYAAFLSLAMGVILAFAKRSGSARRSTFHVSGSTQTERCA